MQQVAQNRQGYPQNSRYPQSGRYPQDDNGYPQGGRYPQDDSGYPQGGRYPQDNGGYPQDNGRYPRDNGRYPQDSGQYPQDGSRYPQDNGRYPQGGGRPSRDRGDSPSSQYRTYSEDVYSIAVPDNWREMRDNNEVTFAPQGGYNQGQGITQGIIVGVTRAASRNLQQATDQYISSLTQENPNLQKQTDYQQGTVGGRNGLGVTLSNVSDITGRPEYVIVYTTLLRNGNMFYMVGVAPQDQFQRYQGDFQNILRSIQIND